MRPKKLKCRKKEGISKWMGKRFGHPLIFLTKCCLGEIGNGKIINRFLNIAKHIFHLFTQEADGKIIKKKLKRSELLAFFANYPASIIGIEACGSAHHWARELTRP